MTVLPQRRVAALLALCALTAGAAPVNGRLATPTGAAPALTVYAWSLTRARLYSVGTEAGQASYTIDLPPGRYWLFASPSDPGAPAVYAGYTDQVACSRLAPPRDCTSHALRVQGVGDRPIAGADLTDWALDDTATRTVDHLLGHAEGEVVDEAELAAPKFTEYPAPAATAARAAALAAGTDPRLEHDRETLAAALGSAPNFAGRMVLLRLGCGTGCESAALVDLASGRVAFPPALAELPAATACSTRGVLLFRRDSRLLTVTGRERNELVTHFYVWDVDTATLRPVAALASALGERCTTR